MRNRNAKQEENFTQVSHELGDVVTNEHVGNMKTRLCTTCFQVPRKWCLACLFSPCYSFRQRRQIYNYEMNKYECCGGAYCTGKSCGTKKCPNLCLCLEVHYCLWCSIFGNRYLIQKEYGIQNSAFEKFSIYLLGTLFSIEVLLACFGVHFGNLEPITKLIYCMLFVCMQSQQQAELEYQKINSPKGKVMYES